MKKLIYILFLIPFILFSLKDVYSQEKVSSTMKSVDITSDSFDMNLKDSQMVFNKNVVIKFPNFDAQCEKAIVYLETSSGKVIKIKMSGKVKLKKDNSEISGENIIFELQNEKITVEGNVKTKIQFK